MLELNFHPFPKIITPRLVLRRLLKKDADALFEIRNNVEAMRYVDRDPMKTLAEAKKLINTIQNNEFENNAILWVIALKEQPEKMIGTIGFFNIVKPNYRAEIGYILHPDCWNKGIMHEAIQPVLHYGFEGMKLHSIEAHINPANAASEHVLLKNGFVKEGHFKECFYYNGRFLDTVVYSLLKK
ncbi:MAG: GNAT family N-acetyltransferase [Bacteroidetes bacterium]|nr:GNAT family N-acetyltransferase [Bacteroidota bacterium]